MLGRTTLAHLNVINYSVIVNNYALKTCSLGQAKHWGTGVTFATSVSSDVEIIIIHTWQCWFQDQEPEALGGN